MGTGLVFAPDGSFYTSDCGGEGPPPCSLGHFGPDGRLLAGWPFAPDLNFDRFAVGRDGTVYALASEPYQVGGPRQLFALDPEGRMKPGWPVDVASADDRLDPALLLSSNASGDIVFVLDGQRIAALDAAGRVLPGWPVAIAGQAPTFGLGADGRLLVASYEGDPFGVGDPVTRTVFTMLGGDGRALSGWPRGSKGHASEITLAPDGSLYYLSATGRLYRHDQTGAVAEGWPIVIQGAEDLRCLRGSGRRCLAVAPDGTAYVTALREDGSEMLLALDSSGQSLPGWPYAWSGRVDGYFNDPWHFTGYDPNVSERPLGLGSDGVVYVAIGEKDGVVILALDRHGRVQPGWPYRPPRDEFTKYADDLTFVSSMAVAPGGRLHAIISAYDRTGSIPNGSATKQTLVVLPPA